MQCAQLPSTPLGVMTTGRALRGESQRVPELTWEKGGMAGALDSGHCLEWGADEGGSSPYTDTGDGWHFLSRLYEVRAHLSPHAAVIRSVTASQGSDAPAGTR